MLTVESGPENDSIADDRLVQRISVQGRQVLCGGFREGSILGAPDHNPPTIYGSWNSGLSERS
ncbi:MAG: hypothetical protein L0Y39_09685 [Methylococcaceae bacterium]|nr:hypothetical protein [Methylococcaceae bacterium]